MKKDIDYSLYLVTDSGLCRGRDLTRVVLDAVGGGVSMVQIREKNSSAGDFLSTARTLKKNLSDAGVPLIINDRVDVAIAARADGVHIGQEDLPYHVVRQMLGPDKIIGISINTYDQLREAALTDVDYLSLSPVFTTQTKADIKEPFGLEGLKKARSMTDKPLITIGGVNRDNLAEIMATGVDGVALVSAVCSADSPADAASELIRMIRDNRVRG
ncbi:thiamine phosphate synthase [Desulfonatronospira sp.]|uniref:thiamine phosphate synthase n=1 Tax=Desulfonatronospira sp. TaxID=1962951 RepID=UPI0025C6E99C|nr:thiamine phosphate synthase [Desulfonatronospira sp.]